MSPILVRPVREQLEHDRVIRLLQAKYKRKFEVGINPGAEQSTPVGSGPSAIFPDLVLQSTERGRKLLGVVEVETSESINHLEALAQWGPFGRLRVPFHLYVPAGNIDTARRLCADHDVAVSEIWTYHSVGDEMRFTMIYRSATPVQPKPAPRVASKPVRRPAPARAKTATKSRARAGRAVAASSRARASSSAKAKKPTSKTVRAQKRK